MKIGIPAVGETIHSLFARNFGRCPYFLIIDSETNNLVASISNKAQNAAGGAGVQAAQSLLDKNVDLVVAPRMGPNAYRIFQSDGISVYNGIQGSVMENLQAFKEQRLIEMTQPTSFGQEGYGGGLGRGGRRGYGRGRRGN